LREPHHPVRRKLALHSVLFSLTPASLNQFHHNVARHRQLFVFLQRIEPFFSFIRPGPHTSPFEYLLLFAVLGSLPVGAAIAARPLFERGADGKRRIYLLNVLLATFMLAAFVVLSVGLGAEIYRCDVLMIPNCD
jgi:hypothetical protein